MMQLIKYKGMIYRRIDAADAKSIIARLSKEATKADEQARETAKIAEKLARSMNEALSAVNSGNDKKAINCLRQAEDFNKNYTNGSSLITGIVHAIKALQS